MVAPVPTSPATSRLTMLAAGLAAPLAALSTWAIGLVLVGLGLIKLVPQGDAAEPASAHLLRLASGGVIDAPWGVYLIGSLQLVLGLGLLVPPSRPLAGLVCLLSALAVVVGAVVHWSSVTTGNIPNATGIALLLLVVLLIAGAALGARAAAKRVGAAL